MTFIGVAQGFKNYVFSDIIINLGIIYIYYLLGSKNVNKHFDISFNL